MLLLHLSDLHFGAHSRFKGEDLTKLSKAFYKDLDTARGSFAKGSRIDLVAVTGDVAESGKPAEFKEGEQFLAALAGELALDQRRFVFVPGNHDISWPLCKKVEADQEEEGFDESELRKRLDSVKLSRYEDFLRSFYGVVDLAEVALPLGRGAYLYSFSDLRLSVAALNSSERESHRRTDHVGFLSREQAEVLMVEWRSPAKAGLLKIVTVHHNPVVTTRTNREGWRKEIEAKGLPAELAARYEGDVIGFEGWNHLKAIVEDSQAQLVLHGHHHAKDEQSWDWRRGTKGRAAVLSAGSLTLAADKLPADEPLSLRLIELDTRKKELRGRSLIFDPRGPWFPSRAMRSLRQSRTAISSISTFLQVSRHRRVRKRRSSKLHPTRLPFYAAIGSVSVPCSPAGTCLRSALLRAGVPESQSRPSWTTCTSLCAWLKDSILMKRSSVRRLHRMTSCPGSSLSPFGAPQELGRRPGCDGPSAGSSTTRARCP